MNKKIFICVYIDLEWYTDRTLRVGIPATLFYASYLSIWTRHFTYYDAFCNKISPITNIVVVATCREQMFRTRAARMVGVN
jgi:hypothetical protein